MEDERFVKKNPDTQENDYSNLSFAPLRLCAFAVKN